MKRYVLIALAFLFSISVIHAQNPSDCPRVMPSGDRIFTDPAQRYQWLDKDGNPIPNAQNCDFIPTQDGRYAVQVSGISAPFRFDPNGNKPKLLKGKVLDFFLKPVAEARIRVQNQTVTTDNQGEFSIPFTGTVGRRETVHCQKNGYFTAVQGFHPSSAETLYTQFILSERKTNFTFDSQKGGIFSHPGVWVNLPANGYVDEAGRRYKGKVNLSYRSARPGDPHFGALMPGGDFLAINAGGQVQALQSYGFTEVILSDEAGKPLQLAPGVTSELRFLIPEGMEAKAPPTMPLWYLPESEGIWREEGTLRRVGSYYIGRVGHFTPWNCDDPYPPSYIKGRVVDCNGQPLRGASVGLKDRNSWMEWNWQTDSNGNYLIPVVANYPYSLTIGINTVFVQSAPIGDTLYNRDYVGLTAWNDAFIYKREYFDHTFVKVEVSDPESSFEVSFDGGISYQPGDTFSFSPQTTIPDSVIVRFNSDSCSRGLFKVYRINPQFVNGCSTMDYDVTEFDDEYEFTSIFTYFQFGNRPYRQQYLYNTNRLAYVLDSVPDSLRKGIVFNIDLETSGHDVNISKYLTLQPCLQTLGMNVVNQFPEVTPISLKELHLYPMRFSMQDTNLGRKYYLGDGIRNFGKWINIPTLEYLTLNRFSTFSYPYAPFDNMPNLKRLGLNLTEPKTILASNQIQSLKRLDIYNSKFGSPDTSRTILNTILGHPNLRQLSIIQPTSIVEFPTLDCPVNENLEEIILKANSVIMQPTLSRFPNITRLTLIGCRLNQTLPIIAQLRRLQQLILSVEGLTNFPTEFSQLDQLTYLGLSGNGLTTLPLEITRLPRLEYLVLTYNGLTSLPREISNLSGTLRGLYIMEGNNFSMEELALIQQWLPNTTIR